MDGAAEGLQGVDALRATASPSLTSFVSLLLLATALACPRLAPLEDTPGMQLLGRAEARLERDRAVLRQKLAHYGMAFPVEPAELEAFMDQIRVHGDGPDLALGVDYALELHGGALLRLLFDHWRPGGRPARLEDPYPFTGRRAPLELSRIYRAHRQQIYLPIPGTPPEALDGRIPDAPQLPRMWRRFRTPFGSESIDELDSYKFLSLLIELEPDPARVWKNRFGQLLSVDLLMQHARGHYLASRPTPQEPRDHSNLHLVELLAAAEARGDARDLAAIQQHFLASELAQEEFDPGDATLLLAHYAESLGVLLGAERLSWSEDQKRRVRSWLETLEDRHFRDVESEELNRLSHLVVGLRGVRANRAKLR